MDKNGDFELSFAKADAFLEATNNHQMGYRSFQCPQDINFGTAQMDNICAHYGIGLIWNDLHRYFLAHCD